jgi:fatty acid desaturase
MKLDHVDLDLLKTELDHLHKETLAKVGQEDLRHAKRIDLILRLLRVLGLATAWIAVNPISVLLLCMANTGRWAMLGHHVGHGAYDKIEGAPKRFQSQYFAKGWRRIIDWLDWLLPGAWEFEHNFLHHYHTGEMADPDFPQKNVESLRKEQSPRWLKYLKAFGLAATWKFVYYAPNTLWYLEQKRKSTQHLKNTIADEIARGESFPGSRIYWPTSTEGRKYWLQCLLPYAMVNFVLLPGLFLLVSPQAALFVLINLLLAEVCANLHSFAVIVTNHAGDDIPCFDQPIKSKGEFYLRQIIGSVNYTGGKPWSDFLQGYTNYQIEHHLWPRLPMLRYRELQPKVEAICQKHGIPYVRQNVFVRVGKLLDLMVGKAQMKVVKTDI